MFRQIHTEPSDYANERHEMVQMQLRNRGIDDQRVLEAMERVPRHEFVPHEYRSRSYGDHPIPIGEGQTISQPFIVALSLQALALSGSERVLEVGTGSGYQTALLAALSQMVYSLERHAALARQAEEILTRMHLENVKVIIGDGSHGLREFAPFNAILVSAAAPAIPPSLLEQLSELGKMVLPVGPPDSQELQLITKIGGGPVMQVLEGCRFVPLIGTEVY